MKPGGHYTSLQGDNYVVNPDDAQILDALREHLHAALNAEDRTKKDQEVREAMQLIVRLREDCDAGST